MLIEPSSTPEDFFLRFKNLFNRFSHPFKQGETCCGKHKVVIFIFWPTDDGRLSTEDRFFGRDGHQPLVSTGVSPGAAAEAKKA